MSNNEKKIFGSIDADTR